MIKSLSISILVLMILIGGYFISKNDPNAIETELTEMRDVSAIPEETIYTERYSARVDRVDVVFEHKDYTEYRLTTNGLVQKGELNTERGYKNDPDATVFVLNWRQPEGEQIYYVKLTDEPTKLYVLDGNREIIRGSALTLVDDLETPPTTAPVADDLEDITGFGWSHYVIDENADFPKSEVSLVIKSEGAKTETKTVATVEGSCNEMPVETNLALDSEQLLCYYAGFGYQFRVMAIGDAYVVQQREIMEASPDFNPPIAPFKTIMKID